MLMRVLRKVDVWLRNHQDPRYRNASWILPRVWRGSGPGLTEEDIARLNLNVRDIGLDPAVVSRQPQNRMLLAMNPRARREKSR